MLRENAVSSRHAGLILIYAAGLVILFSAVACTDEIPPAPNLESRPPAADPAPDERTGTQGGANALPEPTQAPTQPLRAGDGQREWCGGGGGIVTIAEPVIAPGFGAGDPVPSELVDAIEDTWGDRHGPRRVRVARRYGVLPLYPNAVRLWRAG